MRRDTSATLSGNLLSAARPHLRAAGAAPLRKSGTRTGDRVQGRNLRQPTPSHTRALLAAAPRLHEPPAPIPIRLEVPADASRPRGCAFHPRCPLATNRCRTEDPELTQVSGPQGHLAACHYRDRPFAPERRPATGTGPA